MNKETLIAENVEVDMETLNNAFDAPTLYERTLARVNIAQAIVDALDPEDRKKWEDYKNGGTEV